MNIVKDQVIEDISKDIDDEVLEPEVMNDTIMQYKLYHSGEITKDEYSTFIINVSLSQVLSRAGSGPASWHPSFPAVRA